jgi:hypothetical protein
MSRSLPVVGEGVAAFEGMLMTAAYYAPTTAITSGLIATAEAVPVVAGAGVVAAVAGHGASLALQTAGVNETAANLVGLGTAALTGVRLGLLAGPWGGVAGGVIGGAFYLLTR